MKYLMLLVSVACIGSAAFLAASKSGIDWGWFLFVGLVLAAIAACMSDNP